MRLNHLTTAILTALFLACIVAANYITTELGMVPVGFGLVATAGTYAAGLTFVIRDSLQDAAGKTWTLAVIVIAAGVSFLIADPYIAIASAAAYGISEVVDLAIYTPLRQRGYVRAAIASNVVGSLVDSLVFLTIAGFPIREAIAGQMVGKLTITVAAVAAVVAFRAARKPVTT